jgi:hypothetical protein
MTDYAITVSSRKHNAIRIDPDKCVRYEGSEANNNYHVIFYINKDVTAAANNDTITLTLA